MKRRNKWYFEVPRKGKRLRGSTTTTTVESCRGAKSRKLVIPLFVRVVPTLTHPNSGRRWQEANDIGQEISEIMPFSVRLAKAQSVLQRSLQQDVASSTTIAYKRHLDHFLAWRDEFASNLSVETARVLYIAEKLEMERCKSIPTIVSALNYYMDRLSQPKSEFFLANS